MQQDYTDITVILDRSGSMEIVRQSTVDGFNQFLNEQKKQPGRALMSLIQFDDKYEPKYNGKPVQQVSALTIEDFVPRGMTALHDAIGRTINETGARLAAMPESERPGKVLVIIMTDGHENHSSEFNAQKIKEMITHQRTKYQWDFVFIGANQDAILTAGTLGIAAGSSLSYAANKVGTQHAFVSVSNYTNSVRGMGNATFSAADREAQADAGAQQ